MGLLVPGQLQRLAAQLSGLARLRQLGPTRQQVNGGLFRKNIQFYRIVSCFERQIVVKSILLLSTSYSGR